MDLNLLKTFDVVMNTLSVNEAAETLGNTAPAVSHTLNRLRKQYQDPLFVRKGRGIVPTNFAIELHAEIQEPLNRLLNGAKSRQAFEPKTSKRTFRISSHKDLDLMVVPPLIAYRDENAPNVKLKADIEHLNEQDRQTDLRMRKVDLILATVPLEEHGYHNKLLFEQQLVVVCSKNHPRIKDSITQEQFFAEQHLLWQTQRMDKFIMDSLVKEKLPKRKEAYTTGSVCNSIVMAAQTDWLCVTGVWHAKMLSKMTPLTILPLPFEAHPLPVYMTWHNSQHSDTGHQWLKSMFEQVTNNLIDLKL
ncbi:LysR family transcriptional regulator [Aliivibrio fischeri]|uniref:LysR family transcriptional regulator n=1 Tax=Aliivibrio fischeri TaxID=668 RepID=UPI0007C5459D|nr:LysR family transcriptional regulator [Aliivibrio fischeri]MUJ28202.1 LysR family transcriptional regulator [Aliivibrio fischeri]MUK36528.1 LysR family transcriptional regulator [Aliivibrio fischeri]MUL05821.1 LysR family transcriptional regulator [Aliivibrio fischeri]